MKVLFVQSDVFKSYGLMMLCSILKDNGHECDVLVEPLEKDFYGQIKRMDPDIIGFSITTNRYNWMRDIAKEIKLKLKKPIIVGGPHATFSPEIINEDFIDIICIGEGEYALTELLNNLEDGKDINRIKNLWIKKNGKIHKNPLRRLVEDLDVLPFADRSLYEKYPLFKEQNIEIFVTTRGCPYDCAFCFNKSYNELYAGKGKIFRRRSNNSMIDEMRGITKKNSRINHILFEDDIFVLGPRKQIYDFLERYKKEINLPFTINLRADSVDEKLIKKLKSAGCSSIRMGVESANQRIRETILKKGLTNEQITNAVKIIKRNKVKLQLFNILGAPGETVETALETYRFSYLTKPELAWCSLMHPYPKTEIFKIAKTKNLIKKEYDFRNLKNSYFSTLPLEIPDKKEIENLHKMFQFGCNFRIPPSIMRHLIRLPSNILFNAIFRISYALAIKRINNMSWRYLCKTAANSRNFF